MIAPQKPVSPCDVVPNDNLTRDAPRAIENPYIRLVVQDRKADRAIDGLQRQREKRGVDDQW